MMGLGFVFFVFGVSCVFHVLLHRLLARRGVVSLKSVWVYTPGLVAVIAFDRAYGTGIPVTLFVLYILLTMTACMFYLTPYLGGETPASMILGSFKKKRQQTFVDLVGLFTNTGLIWKRIEDLQKGGLIEKNHTVYVTTRRGRIVAISVMLYQKIFNRRLVG